MICRRFFSVNGQRSALAACKRNSKLSFSLHPGSAFMMEIMDKKTLNLVSIQYWSNSGEQKHSLLLELSLSSNRILELNKTQETHLVNMQMPIILTCNDQIMYHKQWYWSGEKENKQWFFLQSFQQYCYLLCSWILMNHFHKSLPPSNFISTVINHSFQPMSKQEITHSYCKRVEQFFLI